MAETLEMTPPNLSPHSHARVLPLPIALPFAGSPTSQGSAPPLIRGSEISGWMVNGDVVGPDSNSGETQKSPKLHSPLALDRTESNGSDVRKVRAHLASLSGGYAVSDADNRAFPTPRGLQPVSIAEIVPPSG